MPFKIDGTKGHRTWGGEVDQDGHRTWHVGIRVRSDNYKDGPALALQTPGIPPVGAEWHIDNDVDVWAFRRQATGIKRVVDDDTTAAFDLELTYSTKGDDKRCKDQQIDDPLLIPDEISGDFSCFQEEVTQDLYGPITNTAFEQIRGPMVEFDKSRGTVTVVKHLPALLSDIWGPMIDTVNDAPLWGYPSRCVKLSKPRWQKKYYGQCGFYYVVTFTFDCSVKDNPITGVRESGFDRWVLNEGTKVLKGHWNHTTGHWDDDLVDGEDPDPQNPAHFIRFTDVYGNPSKALLDGDGRPIQRNLHLTGTGTGDEFDANYILIKYYTESNFLGLGIPLVL